jgi:hypothetical protein
MEGPRLYAWIVFLSEGPITWRELPTKGEGKDPNTTGRAYRIVQPVSEIYDTILLEGVIIGNEGCCKKVRKVAQVDLEGFAKALGFNGEIGEFEFVK